ncbi:MAG: hypothetical protein ACKVIY_01540 [Acidimicrobiales bacterium]
MSDRERREIRDGGGEAFSSAFEMIATPSLFGLLGWFIDSQIGLFPLFTLVLAGLVLVYEVWKLYTHYSASMDAELEARRATYSQGAA